jgi:hypothetical protein
LLAHPAGLFRESAVVNLDPTDFLARFIEWRAGIAEQCQPCASPHTFGDFTPPAKPNVRWCGDLTEIPNSQGRFYLAVVLDLHSRRVGGLAMGAHHDVRLARAALHPLGAQTRVTRPSPSSVASSLGRGTDPSTSAGTAFFDSGISTISSASHSVGMRSRLRGSRRQG